jgi:CheY-like chemotaxis protein
VSVIFIYGRLEYASSKFDAVAYASCMASNIWVKVVGFSDVERHSLNTLFRLSSVRETAYALWSPEAGAPPQVALIDVDSYGANLDLALPSFNANLKRICVGSRCHKNAWHSASRPVDWPALLGVLDGLFSVPGALDIDIGPEVPSTQLVPPGVKTTLLVGLGRENRLYLRARLALAGLTDVDDAEMGCDAAARISQRRYHLVIMGLDLPDADPWALVQTLHELPTPIRSVVVATAAPSWSIMEQAERLGCTGLLEIPFDPRQLIALLEKV